MAPIDEIDFPDLSDQLCALVYAVWTFICDVLRVLWSYISQACLAVWTYPPFEAFRNEFVAALIALWEYVVIHPLTSAAICILAVIFVPALLNSLALCLCRGLDFEERGALRGSYAAHYQSTSYGGNVPRNSTFARCQSHGAKGRGGYRAVGSSR